MFGIKSAPPPGTAAARALCAGWQGFTEEEKQAVAEILIRLAPALAAQGEKAQALPVGKIQAALGAAFRAAWVGILQPRKLIEQIVAALDEDPAAADLRAFCAAVAGRCQAEAGTLPPPVPPLALVP
jgi:hypothetical protein